MSFCLYLFIVDLIHLNVIYYCNGVIIVMLNSVFCFVFEQLLTEEEKNLPHGTDYLADRAKVVSLSKSFKV